MILSLLENFVYLRPQTRGLVAQLDSATDYGSVGCRFESCRGRLKVARFTGQPFCYQLVI